MNSTGGTLSNQRVDPGRYERHRSDQNLRPRAERARAFRQNNQQLLGANLAGENAQ